MILSTVNFRYVVINENQRLFVNSTIEQWTKVSKVGTSLAVPWLRPRTSISGVSGSIHTQGTKILQAAPCDKEDKKIPVNLDFIVKNRWWNEKPPSPEVSFWTFHSIPKQQDFQGGPHLVLNVL